MVPILARDLRTGMFLETYGGATPIRAQRTLHGMLVRYSDDPRDEELFTESAQLKVVAHDNGVPVVVAEAGLVPV
jgi:hypothetical protein